MFFSGVSSVLTRVEDNSSALKQIRISYKKLPVRFSYLDSSYNGGMNLVEDLSCRFEVLGGKDFTHVYHLEFANDHKNRIINIIYGMEERQSFSSLSVATTAIF